MKRLVIVGVTVALALLSRPATARQKETSPRAAGPKAADRQGASAEKETDLSKTLRTLDDAKAVATALEAYAVDNNSYPPSSEPGKLESELVPTYVKALPRLDAWGRAFRVEFSPRRLTYRVASAGADGVFEKRAPLADPAPDAHLAPPKRGPGRGPGDDPGTDLVLEGGTVVRWWKGLPTPAGSEALVPVAK